MVGALRSGCARFVLVAAIAGLSWMVFVGRPSSNGARTLHDGRVHLLLSDPHDQGSTARQDQPGWLTQECRRAVDKLETGTSIACYSCFRFLSTIGSGRKKNYVLFMMRRPANIRLVAFDFDMTIVNVHTGGQWMGGANELARHVGPDFSCYIAHCLDRGLKVSVATFSTQKELISKVLHLSVPTDARGQARTIPVFGGNDYLPEFENGKQSQLMLSIQHFAQQAEGGGDGELVREGEADSEGESKAFLDPSQTLLVDDDVRNIQVARSDGYATLHYRPDMTPLYEAELTTSAS